MFLPITMVAEVSSLDEAMGLANDVDYGLTAGFYGTEEEAEAVFRPDRGRGCLCKPAAGSDHRRMAGFSALRRLEGVRFNGEERRRPLLSAALHA